jgi:hypothetical protein
MRRPRADPAAQRSPLIAKALWLCFGLLGAHRFYLKHPKVARCAAPLLDREVALSPLLDREDALSPLLRQPGTAAAVLPRPRAAAAQRPRPCAGGSAARGE